MNAFIDQRIRYSNHAIRMKISYLFVIICLFSWISMFAIEVFESLPSKIDKSDLVLFGEVENIVVGDTNNIFKSNYMECHIDKMSIKPIKFFKGKSTQKQVVAISYSFSSDQKRSFDSPGPYGTRIWSLDHLPNNKRAKGMFFLQMNTNLNAYVGSVEWDDPIFGNPNFKDLFKDVESYLK